jgi:hypothetical protein
VPPKEKKKLQKLNLLAVELSIFRVAPHTCTQRRERETKSERKKERETKLETQRE